MRDKDTANHCSKLTYNSVAQCRLGGTTNSDEPKVVPSAMESVLMRQPGTDRVDNVVSKSRRE